MPPDPSAASPQFQMGATSSDALSATKLPGPGGIVDRLGQQFQLPRAQTDAEIGDRSSGGNNLGEIG